VSSLEVPLSCPSPGLIAVRRDQSSSLEGEQNELVTYGYNRDGKRGKKQIVVGLLTDKAGEPLASGVLDAP
jgi:transposase